MKQGDKVVCINNKNLPKMLPNSVAKLLVEWQIYTIENVWYQSIQGELVVDLKEIKFPSDCIFQHFRLARFAPVDDIQLSEEEEEELENLLEEVLAL